MDIYRERRNEILNRSDVDLIHVHDFVDGFINDFDRINKRFKDPILGYYPSAVFADVIKGGRYTADGRRHICATDPS
jgi:hypothetical protein